MKMSMFGNTLGVHHGEAGPGQTDRNSVLGEPTEMNPLSVSSVVILQ